MLIHQLAAHWRMEVTKCAKQSGLIQEDEAKRGNTPRTAKNRAPTKVNPIRPRYATMAAASLPDRVKPATGREATSESTGRATRGGWGERAPKDQPRNLGRPGKCASGGTDNAFRETINLESGCGRESESAIVCAGQRMDQEG